MRILKIEGISMFGSSGKRTETAQKVCPRAQNYQHTRFCTDGMRFGTSGEVCGPDMSELEPCEYKKPWQNQGKYGKTVKTMKTMKIMDFRGVSWTSMKSLEIQDYSKFWVFGKPQKSSKSLSPRSKLPKRAFLDRRDAFRNVWGGLRFGHVRVGALRVRETLA